MLRRALSYGFRLIVQGRNRLYERGFFSPKSTEVPVISVGNIVAGGTGKTPVTLLLAERLLKDVRVGIVSRGYLSEAEKRKEPLLVSKGAGPLYPPEKCGDEVFLLSSRLPEAIVVAGKDRIKAANMAAAAGAEVVILDDGMQHRRIARDIEIVVVNGHDPYGGGYFLPRGSLRDDPKRLREADLIVINGGEEIENNLPQVVVENRPQKVFFSDGKEIDIAEKSCVGVFCGIANPDRFVQAVERMGCKVVETHFVADHRKIGNRELMNFSSRAKERGAELLLCTEKDAVKGLSFSKSALPIGWVKSGLVIKKNQKGWEELVAKVKKLIGES